jgi:DNA-binding NtrC family response regulator
VQTGGITIALSRNQVLKMEGSLVKSRPKVLVVEDNEDLRNVLCEQLARAAYKVHGVCDGIEALMELEDKQWDVVLTDCKMPRMNGLDLLGVITACWPDTPVVMTSGEPPEQAKLALKHGAFAWVHKPYDLTHLLQTVHAAVERTLELRVQSERGQRQGSGR